MKPLSPITRRLFPLYGAAFFQGLVFWYAIEKLFMIGIGFDSATIGLMIAVYSAVILLSEIPSGILADRWSRKGVLVLSGITLAASALLGGTSTTVPLYIVAMAIWGFGAAMRSGIYDSIIYDTLVEENGHAKSFKRYMGQYQMIEGAALVVGALVGGVVADMLGMREAYLLSIPAAFASFVFLYLFREPMLHKAETEAKLVVHIRQIFHVVLRQKELLLLLIALITLGVVRDSTLEFSQLWFIAAVMPLLLFGPMYALVLSSFSIAGFLAKFIHQAKFVYGTLTAAMLAIIGLAIPSHFIIFGILQVIVCAGATVTLIALTHQLHDNLPSHLRSGSSSTVSTITRLVIIPFILIFGFVADRYTIFIATILLIVVSSIGAIATIQALRSRLV